MSKRTRKDSFFSKKPLSFIDFWVSAASAIGDHRLGINPYAKNATQLLTSQAVHPEHLRQLIFGSLSKPNGKLSQTIDLTKLLDSLGETAFSLRQTASDDLFDIELLEEIAWHISEHYPHLVAMPGTQDTAASDAQHNLDNERTSQDADKHHAPVVSLAKFKVLRARRDKHSPR